uniref:Protein RRP5 homolog n=1 Tax=Strongyloides papillosus TaxID=174720 RepID=A0A0N5B7Y1_STREA
MFNEEPSFPRSKGEGDNSVSSSRPQKRRLSKQSETKKKLKRESNYFPDDNQKKKEFLKKEKEKHAEIWKRHFCVSYATPGVLCLAAVKEIRELYVLLETSDSVRLKLPADKISYQFAKASANEEIPLSSIVKKGQMLVVKVVKGVDEDANTSEIIVTCVPKLVNSHITTGNIGLGTALVGVFDKLEDKGAIIDLGLNSGTKGFVPYSNLPPFIDSTKLHLGQPFLFSVTKCSSRIIQLTGYVEGNIPQPEEAMHFCRENLFPGMVINCSPDDYIDSGVYTNLGNDIKAYINKYSMPPRFREDLSTFKKPIKGVVTISKPSSPMLIINCNPDIVAISKPEKRLAFDDYKIGDVIECIVKEISSLGYILDLPEREDGKSSLVNAFLKEDSRENCGKLKVGDKVKVRVINFKVFDKSLIVSNKPEVMKQKIMSLSNVVPGKLIMATVRGITDSCVRLRISDTVRGTIPMIHATDRQVRNWQKKFVVGSSVKVRPLFVDEEYSNVVCTAKPTLLQSDLPPVISVDSKYKDIVTHGYIIKQVSKGYLISFYNRVLGFMSDKYAELLPHKSIGFPVKVRIVGINDKDNRIIVVPAQVKPEEYTKEISEKKTEKLPKKSGDIKIKAFQTCEAIVKGPWNHEAGNPYCNIELILPEGNIGRLHASELELKNYNIYDNPIRKFLEANMGKSVRVKVIEMKNLKICKNFDGKTDKNSAKQYEKIKIAECTMKKNKIELGIKSSKLIGYTKKFHVGGTVKCFITNISNPKSLYVEVTPYIKGFIAREVLKDISKNENKDYEEGMMIECTVTSIKVDNTNQTLQLTNLESLAIDIGQEVTGKVLDIKNHPMRIIVSLPGKQLGVLKPSGISVDFEEAFRLFKEFSVNDCFTFKTISYNKAKKSWNIISKIVVDSLEEDPSLVKMVYLSKNKIPYQTEILGHVTSVTPESCLVDISPSITGDMAVPKNVEINVNDIVKCIAVKGKKHTMIKLEYVDTVFDGTKLELEEDKTTNNLEAINNETTVNCKVKPDIELENEFLPVVVISSDSELDFEIEGFNFDSKKSSKKGRKKEKVSDKIEEESEKNTTEGEGKAISKKKARIDQAKEAKKINEDDDEAITKKKSKTDLAKEVENINEEDEVMPKKKSKTDLAKKIKNLSEAEKEKIIFKRQEEISDNVMETNSEEDFERLLAGSQNDSILWINYMGYFLTKGNIKKGREIAERALKSIDYKMHDELYNIWAAYLNMESQIGDEEKLKKVYEKAANNVDTLKIAKHYIKVLRNAEHYDLLEVHIEKLLKKYGHDEPEIWYLYAEHLYSIEKADEARNLQERACLSLPKRVHVDVLAKFAQLEYKLCDKEQGKTMFEKIVQIYKTRTDVWNVYLDLAIKHESIKATRNIFEEIIKLPLGPKKLRPFFKKWITYEEAHGNHKSQKYVHEKAQEIVNDSMESLGLI